MINFIAGFLFGILQFFLLFLLGRNLTANNSLYVAALLICKLVLWVCFFTIIAIFFKDSIFLCGTGAVAALVSCGLVSFLRTAFNKTPKEGSQVK